MKTTDTIPTKNEEQKQGRKKSWKNTPIFGMWADREDMEDVPAYIRETRKPRFSSQILPEIKNS